MERSLTFLFVAVHFIFVQVEISTIVRELEDIHTRLSKR